MEHQPNELAEGLTSLLATLDAAYEGLYQQALAIQQEFWDNYWAGNNRVEFKDRSVLGVRARRKKNGSFYITWFHNEWAKTRSGKSIPLSQHIRQSKNGGYTERSLLKYAQDWEAEVVLNVEARLAPIRRAAKDNRAIKRKIERNMAELFPDGIDDEAADDDPAAQ